MAIHPTIYPPPEAGAESGLAGGAVSRVENHGFTLSLGSDSGMTRPYAGQASFQPFQIPISQSRQR